MEALQELRSKFKSPLTAQETLESRLHEAESRLAFLRMASPKIKPRGQSSTHLWVYRDGERLSNVNGTLRDSKGRVVSNWDGSNLDPESVKRHKQQLNRAGFVNNFHAKGVF